MKSVILEIAARNLLPLLLLFAVFLLVRGHNEPGGGFAAGMVAAASAGLYLFTEGVKQARILLPTSTENIMILGLGLVLGTGIWGLANGGTFLEAGWYTAQLPIVGELSFGTPYLFDAGIALLAFGALTEALMAMAEEE